MSSRLVGATGGMGKGGRWPATAAIDRLLALLGRRLLGEADRWFLFAPVAVALGVMGYFALPAMPGGWIAAPVMLLAVAAFAVAWRTRQTRPLLMMTMAALGLIGVGFLAALIRLLAVEAPILARAGVYRLEGTILEVQPTTAGARLSLGALAVERLPPDRTPALVRVSARHVGALTTGDRVRLLARLQRPQGPALPGGFDYARQAYFQRLGALGFAYGKVELLGHVDGLPLSSLANPLRERIAQRVASFWPGPAGQMSAALLTGLDGGIDQATWRDMQLSGLAHLISISGLHMAIVAGAAFWVLRYVLALIPALALHVSVKRVAALGAMLAVTGYLLISDGSVPALRSWLMVMVAFTAILLDRNPFSLRLLAFACLLVLLYRPESLLGASFQLSFAAVLALMAAYETGAARLTQYRRDDPPIWLGPLLYLGAAIVSTVIATAATTPLSAYHFQTITTYGALANLIVIPLSTFVTMPAGMLGLALMPFGLDAPAFMVMTASVRLILTVAHVAAALPGAALQVAQAPWAALPLFGAGMIWLCLWRQRWRFLGIPAIAAAMALILTSRSPDLLVQPYFDMAAVRGEAGGLRLLTRQSNGLVKASWLRALGTSDAAAFPPAYGAPADGIACDPSGCVLDRHERKVAMSLRAEAIADDCVHADIVIAAVGPERCPAGAARLIGPLALRRSEGIALWLEAKGITLRQVADGRGHWPWTWRPGNRRPDDGTRGEKPALTQENDADRLPSGTRGTKGSDE